MRESYRTAITMLLSKIRLIPQEETTNSVDNL